MKILVLNAGSSSLKFELFDGDKSRLKGLAQRIGEERGHIRINDWEKEIRLQDHGDALKLLIEYMHAHPETAGSAEEIRAVGHRVVHGGSDFVRPVVIDERVKAKIRELFSLAPLHNPANLTGIETAEKYFPRAVQVAVFDTAFHQSIPEEEHRYAIPEKYYREGIRQYGFHGISHQYVSREAMKRLGRKDAKIITLHLGNGASMTAVRDGKSIATTMGFGPLSGLIMGTRSGDIDPSVLLYLLDHGMSHTELARMLNKESGMKALAGSNDMRDVEAAYERGEARAVLALRMYAGRIRKYIGAYTALMNGLDALVFTAGIGEHSPLVRALALENTDYLGIEWDKRKNEDPASHEGAIHADGSRVKIWVIPTREEWEIALQTQKLLHEHV